MDDIQYLKKHGYSEDDLIIQWPSSQFIMDKEWFNECTLINDKEGLELFGSSAYVVPLDRITDWND